jgi:hypothetical protein
MQPSNTKHLGTLASPGARGRCGRRHPLHGVSAQHAKDNNSWNPGTARGTGSRIPARHPPGRPRSAPGGDGIAQHMHTRHRLEQQTQTARTTRSGSKSWEIRRAPSATPTHVASNHARAATHSPTYHGQLEQQAGTWYKFSDTDKCPLCHQTDGGGHIASGCQDPIMKRMYTERQQGRQNSTGRDLQRRSRQRHLHGRRGASSAAKTTAPTSASTSARRDAPPQADQGNRGARPVAAHQAARHHALQHARTLAGRQSAARHLHRSSRPKTRGRPTS